MKKIFILTVLVIFSGVIFSQTVSEDDKKDKEQKELNLKTLEKKGKIFIVFDSGKYEIEDISKVNIDARQVENIEIFKDKLSKKIYGSEKGVIFIYPKEEYKEELEKEIKTMVE